MAGCDHPDVNVEEIQGGSAADYNKNLTFLLHSENLTNYKWHRKGTGISRPSLMSGLPVEHCLSITLGLAGDSMHVPTLNLGELFLPLWCGLFQCAAMDTVDSWDWAVLKGEVWQNHGEAVGRAWPYMPTSFDRPPHNIAKKISSGYKGKEWQGYFYGLALALLHGILPSAYWKNLCKLVHAIRILHQRSIPLEQLLIAQSLLDKFHIEYETLYMSNVGLIVSILYVPAYMPCYTKDSRYLALVPQVCIQHGL